MNYGAIFFIIFVATYVLIIYPKIDKVIGATAGSLLAIIVGLELHVIEINHHLIKVEDLMVLGLIIGNLMMVEVASKAGIFQFISIKILKQTKGDPGKILFWMNALTFILSSLVNNISAIIIVSALTMIVCEELRYDPKPFIISEVIISSTGGLTTLTSAIPNIIVSTTFNITYLEFILVSGTFSVMMFFLTYIIIKYMFPLEDTNEPEVREAKILQFDEWSFVKDKVKFYIIGAIFLLTIFFFLLSDTIGIPLTVLALTGAVSMAYVWENKLDSILEKVDWGLLTFFLALFILISTLEITGVMEYIAELLANVLSRNEILSAIAILWISAILSAILDNIVLAATFAPVILDTAHVLHLNPKVLAWALIYGTNLGGGFTPIAAPANLIGIGTLKRSTGKNIGWVEFFKTSGVIVLIRLFLSSFFILILSLVM